MSVSPEKIERYQQWLSEARGSQSTIEIPNEFPWNARLAVHELLQFAIERQRKPRHSGAVMVRIFTGSLSPFVYDASFRHRLQQLFVSGGRSRVLIWNAKPPSIISEWENIAGAGNLEIRCSKTRNLGDTLNHFLVVDDVAYRLEAAHPYFDGITVSELEPLVPSRICFNNSETGSELQTFFDGIWNAIPAQSIAPQN
jgi:hypothetical protein